MLLAESQACLLAAHSWQQEQEGLTWPQALTLIPAVQPAHFYWDRLTGRVGQKVKVKEVKGYIDSLVECCNWLSLALC